MIRHLLAISISIVFTGLALAQSGETPNAKAKKYHSVLVKRPKPGTLFDRFYNTWLDTGTLDGLEAFLKAEADAGKTTEQRLLLAFFYAKQRDNIGAIEQFRAALENDPGNADAWYEKAKIEAKTLDFDTAIADLDKAAAAEPSDDMTIEISKLQGKLHLRGGATEKAMEVWKQLLTDHPKDEELREDLIELQVTEGLYDEAVITAKDLADTTKDVYKKVIRQMRLGDIHQRAGHRDKALESYSSTLAQVGHGTWLEKEVLAQIEQVHKREENMVGLDEYYKKLIETDGKRIRLRERHASILTELGDKERAVAAYDQILSLTPGERSYREAYVTMLASFQDYDKAITQQEQLTKAYPDDGELLIKLAELHHAKKDKEKTTSTIEQYLESSDQSEYAHLRAARLFERYLMTEEADGVYKALTEAHPNSNAALEAYAAFLHKQEKTEAAIALWTGMADGASRSELVRIARSLSTRREFEAAFDLLLARFDDFSKDPIFLTELCTLAASLDKHEKALPWARTAVQLASSAFDLESATALFAKLVAKADLVIETVDELQNTSPRLLNDSCLLAELLEREGNSAAADQVLAALATDKPQDTSLVLGQKIRMLRQRNEWIAAANATTQLIELPGGRKSVNVQKLIELYRQAYELDKAMPWIAEWKKLSPGSTQPWITEARLLNQQEKFDESVDVLRQAVQQFDGNEQIRAELASIYADQGKMADADRMYWNLYEESEELADKLTWVKALASTAQAQGKVAQLVDNFEERRASNRASILPLLALAELHRVTSNYEGRRQALLEATRMRPEDVKLLHEIARIEQAEGDWEGAIKTLESAVPLDTSDKTQQRIAQIHLNNGNDDEGFRILQQIAGGEQMDPRDVETVADSMLGSYHFERALEFLAPFVEKYPDDYRLGYLYAVCLEEEWQTDAALTAFERLLAIKQEIPGLKMPAQTPNNRLNSQERYLSEMREWAPLAVVEMIRQSNNNFHQAYMHRQSRRSGYRRYGWNSYANTGSAPSNITMPVNVDALQSFVVPHLGMLSEELSEDRQSDLLRVLEDQGLPYPKMMLKMASSQGQQAFDFEAWLEANPDDVTVLGYWVMRGMYTYWDAEIAKRAFATFKADFPQMALSVAFYNQAMQSDETKSLLEEGVALLKTIEKPKSSLTSMVARTLSQASAPNSHNTLTEEQQSDLSDLLLAWHPKLDDKGKNQVFQYVAMALRQRNDLEPFFTLLDQELARLAKEQKGTIINAQNHASMLYAYFGHNNRNNALIRPLPFPPPLQGLPSNIVAMITSLPNEGYYQNTLALEPEQLEPPLKAIKHPSLKVLVAYQADKQDLVASLLAEQVSAEDPSVDSFVLAAAYAAEQLDIEKAGALLHKASFLPNDRYTRSLLDGAILSWALDAKADSPLRNHGKAAALRLRRQTLQAEQRTQLANAMETLGMDDAATKLLAKSKMPGGSMFRGSGGFSSRSLSSGRTRPRYGRVEQLIMDDRFNQAVNVSAQELKRHASNYLMPHNVDNSFYDSREVVNPIRAHSLTEDVLKAANPGEEANTRQLAQYAMIYQVLGKTEQAYGMFKKVIAARPKDEGARIRLFLLAAEHHPEEAADHLLKIRPQVLGSLGNGIQNLISNTRDFGQKLAIVNVIKSYLDNLEAKEKVNLGWISQVAHNLGEAYYNGDYQLPSIYALRDETYQNDDVDQEERNKMIRDRREAHDAFCKMMLNIPQLTIDGFRRFASPAIHEGKVPEDLAAIAKKALLNHKPFGNNAWINHYYNNENEIRWHTPESYLIEHAWETNTMDSLQKELVPALTEAKREQEVRRLTNQISLFQCKEEDFSVVANKLMQSASGQGNIDQQREQLMTMIVNAWKMRNLDAPIDDILLAQLKKMLGRSNRSPAISEYLVALRDQGHANKAAAFLEGVAEIFLGPKDKRLAYIEKHYVPNSWGSNTPNGNIHQFQNLLSEFGRNPKLAFLAMDHYEAYGFAQSNRGSSPLNHFRSSNVIRDPKILLDLFKASPWLGNVDTLRFFPADSSNADEIFLISLLSNLKGTSTRNQESREGLQKFLSEQEPTLGVKLIQGYLSKEEGLIAEALAEHGAAIRALPEDQMEPYAKLSRTVYSNDRALEKASDEAKAIVNELRDLRQLGPDEEIEAFLAKINKPSWQNQNLNMVDETQRLLALLFRANPDDPAVLTKAEELFETAVQAIQKAKRNGTLRRSYGADVTEAGRILYYLINRGNSSSNLPINSILFTLSHLAKPLESGEEIEIEDYLLRQLGSHLVALVKKECKEQDITADSLQYLHYAHKRFTALVPPESGPLLVSGFRELFESTIERTQDEFLTWLEALPADDESHMTREMIMALRLYIGLKRQPSEKEGENAEAIAAEVPVELAHYLAHIQNEERPSTWRLALSYGLTRQTATHYSQTPLHKASAPLLATSWVDRNVTVKNEQASLIIANFLKIKERDDAWNADAIKIAEAWLRTQLQQANSRSTNTSSLQQLMELCLASNAEQPLNRLVSQYAQQLGSEASSLMVLINHGEYPRGGSLLRKSWQDMQPSYGNQKFDDTLREHLPKFLATIDKEELRYFAEVMVSNCQEAPATVEDKKSEEKEKTKTEQTPPRDPREVRLNRLAARFGSVSFSNKLMRERCLSVLASEYSTTKHLKDVLAEAAKGLDLKALLEIDDSRLREQRIKIMASFISHAAAQGETKPFDDALAIAEKSSSRGSQYYRRQAIESITDNFVKGLSAQWALLTEEQQRKTLPALRKVVFMPKKLRSNSGTKHIHVALLAHAYLGELADFDETLNGLKETDRKSLHNYSSSSYFYTALGELFDPATQPLDKRFDALFATADHAFYGSSLYNNHATFLSSITDKALTKEEILSKSDEILEALPNTYSAASALSSIAESLNELDRSLKFTNIALRHGTTNNSQTNLLFRKASLLLENDRREDALLALSTIAPSTLNKEQIKKLDKDREEILAELQQHQEETDPWAIVTQRLNISASDVNACRALSNHYHEQGFKAVEAESPEIAKAWFQLSAYISQQAAEQHPDQIGLTDGMISQWLQAKRALGELDDIPVVIKQGAEWKYLDDGSDQKGAWRESDFDDSTWRSGAAQLGYGDGDEVTQVESGGSRAHITTYFRHEFDMPEAKSGVFLIDMIRDDGVVVYLNGKELLRDNMRKGDVKGNDLATVSVSGDDENKWVSKTIRAEELKSGSNVLAAEIHQRGTSSSDISFDFSLSLLPESPDKELESTNLDTLFQQLPKDDPSVSEEIAQVLKNL